MKVMRFGATGMVGQGEFREYDACFFGLGVSSAGMSEDAARR